MFNSLRDLTNTYPWVSDWLTPVWLIGVGAALGLAALVIVIAIAAALSRVPPLGRLYEDVKKRWTAVSILTVLFLVLVGVARFTFGNSTADSDASAGLVEKIILMLFFLVPSCFGTALLLVALMSRRTIAEMWMIMREGVLRYILMLVLGFSLFGLLATVLVQQPREILSSLWRLPYAGSAVDQITVEPLTPGQSDTGTYVLEKNIAGSELQSLVFSSDQPLEVITEFSRKELGVLIFRVSAGEDYRWNRESQPLPETTITKIVVHNMGADDAHVTASMTTAPEYPQVSTVLLTAVSVVVVVLLYLLQRLAMPRISALALATAKSEIAQPLFRILIVLGVVLMITFIWIPYNTFGEDIKMLKDSGLPLIMMLGIIQAVWAASMSISEEVEGRTALTVLSKPISRSQFILGKFLGIVWTVALLFLLLGVAFMIVVSYKMVYDGAELPEVEATWQLCHLEMIRTVPGLVLAFMETIVLAAISVAISTRLPMLANFSITGTIFVLGNLTPLIVQSSTLGAFGMVKFFGQLIATVFPNLEVFNVQAAVAGNADVPFEYLGWSLIYCFLFGTIAMLLALVLFEDRDLA